MFKIIPALVIIVLSTFSGLTQDLTSIRIELERIEKSSLELRSLVMPTVTMYGFESEEMRALNDTIQQFDSISLTAVEKIIKQYGWLGQSEIGKVANHALFLTLQHASSAAVRNRYFPLLESSAQAGDSERSDMATMMDRILIEDGKPQLYGTQFHMVDGALVPYPIRDEKNVNKRRRKVGLKKLK